jgi:hypothetical protein
VVDGKTGLLIPIRVNEISKWVELELEGQDLDQEFAYSFGIIRERLVEHLAQLVGARELVRTMGEALFRFCVSAARRKLANIYEAALDR